MSRGPSPIIPFLLVGALGVFIYWEVVFSAYEYVSEVQETTIALFAVLSIALLMIVGSTIEFMVPLGFMLVVFLLGTELIGPLMLLVLIHLLGKYYYSSERAPSAWWRPQQSSKDEGDATFAAWLMLICLCLILCLWLSEAGGYGRISLVFGLAFMLYFNMQ